MLTCAPGALVKETNIDNLHWEVMKSGMFHFMKVKKLLFLMKKILFLTFLTKCPGELVSMTQRLYMIILFFYKKINV